MRAQVAIEYLMMVGYFLLLLIPLWLFLNSAMGTTKAELQTTYAEYAVIKIVEAVNVVYVQGAPAKLTVYVDLPEGVESVRINNRTISIFLHAAGGISEVYAVSLPEMRGSISNTPGTHKVFIEAAEVKIGEGYVNITEGG